MAAGDEFGGFAQKVLEISGTGRTTRVRDDAIGAEEITTILYLEICASSFVVKGESGNDEIIVCVTARRLKCLMTAGKPFSYQLAERSGLWIRHDEIDFRIFCDVGNRRFAAHQDDESGWKAFSGGAYGLTRFLGGYARDSAAVDDGNIRWFAPWNSLIAMGGQIAFDSGGIGLVETASQCMDGECKHFSMKR